MGDQLERASAWLQAQRHKHLARSVTYRRGAETARLSATIGRTVFRIDTGYGATQRIEGRDYLVRTADLVLGGKLTLPERGDEILEEDGTSTFVYEVMAPGDEPHYRYSDPYRRTLRIHTKLVDVETPAWP